MSVGAEARRNLRDLVDACGEHPVKSVGEVARDLLHILPTERMEVVGVTVEGILSPAGVAAVQAIPGRLHDLSVALRAASDAVNQAEDDCCEMDREADRAAARALLAEDEAEALRARLAVAERLLGETEARAASLADRVAEMEARVAVAGVMADALATHPGLRLDSVIQALDPLRPRDADGVPESWGTWAARVSPSDADAQTTITPGPA